MEFEASCTSVYDLQIMQLAIDFIWYMIDDINDSETGKIPTPPSA